MVSTTSEHTPRVTDLFCDNILSTDIITPQTITTRVPGKLFLAGEYAVTCLNHQAIIAPVPRYLTVELIQSTENTIYSTQQQIQLEWLRHCGAVVPLDDNVYPSITKTIEIVETYVKQAYASEQKPFAPLTFELFIDSQLDDKATGKKYGLGSSGALCVAVTKALLQAYGIHDTPLRVYKLAVITQLALQSNGSFGDIAVSAFQQLIHYQNVSTQWLHKQLETTCLLEVVAMNWNDLIIEPIQWAANNYFLVGWTNSPASSQQLVDAIAHVKQTDAFYSFLTASNACVQQLKTALHHNDKDGIQHALQRNQSLLEALSPAIDTPLLQQLRTLAASHGAVAKISGAGGGDCGFAHVTSQQQQQAICKAWQTANITPLFLLGDSDEFTSETKK